MSERRYFVVSFNDKLHGSHVFGFLSILLGQFFGEVKIREMYEYEVDEEDKS